MNFEEFQNLARLFVIGVLEPAELPKFEAARESFGQRAEDYILECSSLNEAFALSLKPAKASDEIKDRLMRMVRQRKGS